MPDTSQQERMQTAFDEARRAVEAKDLRSGQDWQRLQEIEGRAKKLLDIAERQHTDQYDERVSREIVRLLHDKYSPDRKLKPKAIVDTNDVERKAHENVRDQHAKRVSWIEQARDNDLDRLKYLAREPRERGHDFTRSTPGHEGYELKWDFGRIR